MNPLSFSINPLPDVENHKSIVECTLNHNNESSQKFLQWHQGRDDRSIEDLNLEIRKISLFPEGRYGYEDSSVTRLLRKVFDSAWSRSKPSLEQSISIVNRLDSKTFYFHLTIKKTLFINCPKIIGLLLKSTVFFPAAYVGSYSVDFFFDFYENFIPNRIVPFLINHCPKMIREIGTMIATSSIVMNKYEILFCCYIIAACIRKYLSNTPYLSNFAEIFTFKNCIVILILFTQIDFGISLSFGNSVSFLSLTNAIIISEKIIRIFLRISGHFSAIAIRNEHQIKHDLKNRIQNIWINSMLPQQH